MASRKKNSGSGGIEIVLAGAILALGYVAPALLLGFWLVTEIRTRTSAFKRATQTRFPSQEELDTIRKVESFKTYADNEIKYLFNQGHSSGLRTRQYDGLFDGRSGLGSDLNQKIEGIYLLKEKANQEEAHVR